MSEKSEESEGRHRPSGFNPLTRSHDDSAAHSMETVANGNKETSSSRSCSSLPRSRNASLQGSGFGLRSSLFCDHSGSSAVGGVGRRSIAGSADGASSSGSFFYAPSLSSYHGNDTRNGSCLEAEQKRLLESCSSENGVIDVRSRQPKGRSSLDRISSLSGCDESMAAQHRDSYLNSIDRLRFVCLSPPVEPSMSAEASNRNGDVGEQTDAGYMDDGDAFVDSSDSPPTPHGYPKGGTGIHFAYDTEPGAAGGGGGGGGCGLEDFGDFIDTDIPRNRNSSSQFSSRSNDSVTSSYEELVAMTAAIDNVGAEEGGDLGQEGERARPNSMVLQSTLKQHGIDRVLDFPVNNLNQAERRRTIAAGSTDDLLTTQNQSRMDSACMSDSMNFGSGVAKRKSWRWSDGDTDGNFLPSMIAATSQASDSSYGTPSVPLVSPFSVEDEVLASAASSPLTPSRPQGPSAQSHDPVRRSSNLEGSRTPQDEARGNAVWRPLVQEPNLNSASFSRISLLQNLNQATPKHLLEKYFGWEATASAPLNAAASKHSINGAKVKVQSSHLDDCVDVACCRCGLEAQSTENGLIGSGFCDFSENFDGHFAERWPENLRLDSQKNRRFSCQNLIVTDSLEFPSSLSSLKGKSRAWDSDGITLSDDNLHSTHFAKRPEPLSLHMSWHDNRECVKCSHLVTRRRNAELLETGVRPKDTKAKKLSSEAVFLSLSEDDDDDEDVEEEEGRVGYLRRHRNKNGRHHVGCRDDKNLSWLTDGPSIMTSCGACLVIILLRHLGVTDVSRHVYELMHVNRPLDKASLPEYLLASSAAGVNAEMLVDGLAQLTEDRIYGKFFHLFPQRSISLIHWLKYWIKQGAVPLATLKRETKDGSGDVWHHKIISASWIQSVNDALPMATEDDPSSIRLSSDSSIRISRHQVVTRWRDDCDLSILMSCTDTRWQEMNVLGQVVNILREERLQTVGGCRPQLTSHVVIPTHFKSGVTLYVRKDSAGYEELRSTVAELPLADRTAQDSARKTSLVHDKNQNKKRDLAPGVRETVI